MDIDVDATLSKEILIHAELYRILKNVLENPTQQPSLLDTVIQLYRNVEYRPGFVLIEASIRGSDKEPDLILVGKNDQGNMMPLLVIEVKPRREGSPTTTFKYALKQSYEYARSIDCYYYSAYDGHNFVMMQRQRPFIIGLMEKKIMSLNRQGKIDFAKLLWAKASILNSNRIHSPHPELCRHFDYHQWRRTIVILLRDSYTRFLIESGITIDERTMEREVEHLIQWWDNQYRPRQ